MRMTLVGLELDDTSKVYGDHGGDVGNAEAVGDDEFPIHQTGVKRHEELLQSCQATLRQFRNLRVVHRPG